MEIVFSQHALEDLAYWQQLNEQKVLKKIRQLLENIAETPYQGTGKPEPLKHHLSGMWSRRINKEHRLIYEINKGIITVHALREHY